MPNSISDFFSSLAGVKVDWRDDWRDDWANGPGKPGAPRPDYRVVTDPNAPFLLSLNDVQLTLDNQNLTLTSE